MISYLTGSIKFKTNSFITLLIGGVGYKVFVPANLLTDTKLSQQISLFIHTQVKEDVFDLYGFLTQEELTLFEFFLGVSGIGPKTALAIFSNSKLPKIKEAIIKGDVDFFTSIPRLGKKNAQKIIIELRTKLGSIGELDLISDSGETKEIIEALKSFGFNALEAREAVKSIKDLEGSTSDKIKQALKWLGMKKS
jgi:Holliday junction DNA helicase RuvA